MNKDQKDTKSGDKHATHSAQGKGADQKSADKKTDAKKDTDKKSASTH